MNCIGGPPLARPPPAAMIAPTLNNRAITPILETVIRFTAASLMIPECREGPLILTRRYVRYKLQAHMVEAGQSIALRRQVRAN